jgi:hypothetical protein
MSEALRSLTFAVALGTSAPACSSNGTPGPNFSIQYPSYDPPYVYVCIGLDGGSVACPDADDAGRTVDPAVDDGAATGDGGDAD